MRTGLLIAAVALSGLVLTDASARFDGTSLSFSDTGLSKVWNSVFSQPEALPVSQPRQDKAVVLIEYAVLPPVQRQFVEIFKKLQAETEKEEGVKVFGLSRTVDENLNFYLYSEWDNAKDYGAHFEKEYVKEYLEAISKIGVIFKVHFLDQITFIGPK